MESATRNPESAILDEHQRKDLLRFFTAGSVDDGKSTLIGRLLYESQGIYEDQLASVRAASGRKGSAQAELDLSLVTDGLKAEREQGITIDVAYRYFSTPRRKFIIADTPGHEQYTRNTATGASTASLAVILIDATKGVVTQSRRHAFIASLLGIPHLAVAVNKMDLAGYSEEVFRRITADFADFAAKLEVRDLTFIPVSALKGDNVVTPSANMPWYRGTTLLNHLETVHVASDRNLIDLRLPVQYIWRPGPDRRACMGTVASGVIRPGDAVVVLPSGLRSRVRSLAGPDGRLDEGFPPLPVTVELEDQIDVSRGDMLVHVHNLPHVGRTFEAMIVWMDREPMEVGRLYTVKHATRMVPGTITQIRYRVDVDTLHRQEADALGFNEIGRCLVELARPIAYDPYELNRATGALILIDRLSHQTVGAGMILPRERAEAVLGRQAAGPPPQAPRRSAVEPHERASRLGQRPFTVWLTGLTGSGKSTIAYALERRLFDAGKVPSVLDGDEARSRLSRDLGFSADDRMENVRRAAEAARLLNEAGLIAVCAFVSPHAEGRRNAAEIIGRARMVEVYLAASEEVCRRRRPEAYEAARRGRLEGVMGQTYEVPDSPDLKLATDQLSVEECVERIVELLKSRGLLD